jgi:hypothetical protein
VIEASNDYWLTNRGWAVISGQSHYGSSPTNKVSFLEKPMDGLWKQTIVKDQKNAPA